MKQNSIKRANLKALMDKLNQASKYASESAAPADPNEEAPQPTCTRSTVDPTPGQNPKEQLQNDQTNAAQPSDMSPKSGGSGLEEKEKKIVEKAANTTKKLLEFANINTQPSMQVTTEKTAATPDNIANDIVLSYDVIAKVASVLTDTEEGRIALQRAIDSEKGKQMQLATLNEIKYAAEQVQQFEELQYASELEEQQLKLASLAMLTAISRLPKKEQKQQFKLASQYFRASEIHRQNMEQFGDQEFLKHAYAQGALDAQDINDSAAVEEGDPTIEGLDAFGTALDEMVASNEITQEQAQILAQMAVEAAQADNDSLLSPEEAQMFLEQAVQQGLIDPRVAEELVMNLMSEEGAAAPEAAAVPPAPVAPQAGVPEPQANAIADQTVVEPLSKQAVAKYAALAQKYTKLAYATKVAEENTADVELSLDDIVREIEEAVESGELTDDDSAKLALILDAVANDDPDGHVVEVSDSEDEDDEDDEDDDEDDDFDDDAILEESIKEAAAIAR